jgi:hypothetical protein
MNGKPIIIKAVLIRVWGRGFLKPGKTLRFRFRNIDISFRRDIGWSQRQFLQASITNTGGRRSPAESHTNAGRGSATSPAQVRVQELSRAESLMRIPDRAMILSRENNDENARGIAAVLLRFYCAAQDKWNVLNLISSQA